MGEKWYLVVIHISRIIVETWPYFLPWVVVVISSLVPLLLLAALSGCVFGPWFTAVASQLLCSLFLALCWFFLLFLSGVIEILTSFSFYLFK